MQDGHSVSLEGAGVAGTSGMGCRRSRTPKSYARGEGFRALGNAPGSPMIRRCAGAEPDSIVMPTPTAGRAGHDLVGRQNGAAPGLRRRAGEVVQLRGAVVDLGRAPGWREEWCLNWLKMASVAA
jgi:hypothetical protein